jgi:putative ABC transport system permease protein
VEVVLDSASYFSVLGVDAAMGPVFGPQDNVEGIGTVAVLSDGSWKRRFGADANIAGKQIRIDNDRYTVVGVLPPLTSGAATFAATPLVLSFVALRYE